MYIAYSIQVIVHVF